MNRTDAHKYRGLTSAQVSDEDARRFARMVEVTDGCWFWRGSERGQYGEVRLRPARIHTKAHKLAVVLSGRDIPDGFVVMHLCDEPSCVRPDHLRIGTQQENVRDCIAKGRHKKKAA